MKTNKLFATLFLMLVFIIKITAQVPPYVPTNGLIAWYPFTSNVNDISGNGNNGTNNGATLTTDRGGNLNSAYYFDGLSNYISSTPVGLPIGNAARTISSWFTTTTSAIPTSQYPNIQTITMYGNPMGGPVIFPQYILAPTGKAYFESGSSQNAILSNNAVNNGVWHNIVTTYGGSGTPVRMYIDGVFENSTGAVTLGTASSYFGIGNNPSVANIPFRGKIDDIGIWNRALNQAEITALYNAVLCTAPIASITTQGNSTFCAGGSCTLNANSGNSYTYQWYNNGTLINGATAITFTASQAGNYTVKVTDGLTSCFTTSQPQSVIVNPQPNVSFGLPISSCWVPGCVIYRQINASTIPLNGTPNGGTYQGPGISGSAFSPTVAGLGNKNLKYTYTDNNGCSNFANQSVIIYDTIICPTVSGIIKNSEDFLNEESVKIYPNPNQGFFNLELTECKNSIIKITDVLGKTILNQKAELFNEIDLKNQSSGVYTINIITDKKIKYSTKFIKE
jgi:hypothetical protein